MKHIKTWTHYGLIIALAAAVLYDAGENPILGNLLAVYISFAVIVSPLALVIMFVIGVHDSVILNEGKAFSIQDENLDVPGRDLDGVVFAMHFLEGQNRKRAKWAKERKKMIDGMDPVYGDGFRTISSTVIETVALVSTGWFFLSIMNLLVSTIGHAFLKAIVKGLMDNTPKYEAAFKEIT